MSDGDQREDRLEREIDIDAPIERVWELVSRPGWWIGDGDGAEQVTSQQGDMVIVEYPGQGGFPVLPVSSDPPRHAAFRCSSPGQDPKSGPSTLVEFFLSEREGGTTLKVAESGFASLELPPDAPEVTIEDNIDGWEQQLAYAKRDVEGSRS